MGSTESILGLYWYYKGTILGLYRFYMRTTGNTLGFKAKPGIVNCQP